MSEYKKLKILEAHELGTGILVETDAGHIDPKNPLNESFLIENKSMDYKNPFEFYAVLQKCDTQNRNGRWYPEKILKRESDKYKKLIEKGASTSELNHPESSLIDLDRISHIITDVWWEGNILMGKLRLMTSPAFHAMGGIFCKGDQAANLIRHGATLGISSRGVGTLKKNGEKNEVQDDFELICFDLVHSPSTPGAYLFNNKEDRHLYDEKLEEEINPEFDPKKEKSVDLMKKLSLYINNAK